MKYLLAALILLILFWLPLLIGGYIADHRKIEIPRNEE